MSKYVNYEEVAQLAWDDIPEGKVLPYGFWRLKIKGVRFIEPKEDAGEDASGRVQFVLKAVEPVDGVDEAELAELGEGYDYGIKPIYDAIWIEDAGSWKRVLQRLEVFGVKPEEGEQVFDTFKRARGATVIAYLEQRTFKNKNGEVVTENTASQFTEDE